MDNQPKLRVIEEIDWFDEGKRIENWLHPGYGPYPDLCLLLHDDNVPMILCPNTPYKRNNPRGWFTCAAWDEPGSVITMVWEGEGTDETHADIYHQGISQSYRWRPVTGRKWYCNVNEVTRADVMVEPSRTLRCLIYASVMNYCSY